MVAMGKLPPEALGAEEEEDDDLPIFYDEQGKPIDPSQLTKEQLEQIMVENAKEFGLAGENTDLMMPDQPVEPEAMQKLEEKQEMENEMNNLMGDGAADSDDQIAKQQHELFFVPSKHKSKWSWIDWFLKYSQHEYVVEVDQSFIKDEFNLIGLKDQFSKNKKFTYK